MQRILNADIVDITPIDGGFIYAEKKMLENGSCRVSFYSYDCETSISTPITRGEYVSCKFGQNGSRIADELGQKGEFIFAQPTRFFNNCTVTLDRAGTFSLFTPEGSCVRRYEFTYQGAPACNPVAYEKSLWCVVPERDAIINYSIDEARVLLRIGGGAQSAGTSMSATATRTRYARCKSATTPMPSTTTAHSTSLYTNISESGAENTLCSTREYTKYKKAPSRHYRR